MEKEMPVSEVLDRHSLVRQVRTVASGLVLVSWDDRYPQFAIDLKNMKVMAEFRCSGETYLFQTPWPPALLVDSGKSFTHHLGTSKYMSGLLL